MFRFLSPIKLLIINYSLRIVDWLISYKLKTSFTLYAISIVGETIALVLEVFLFHMESYGIHVMKLYLSLYFLCI